MNKARPLRIACVTIAALLMDHPYVSSAKLDKSTMTANRRWFDDKLNRTTLAATFDNPTAQECFALAGLFSVTNGRTTLMFPQAVAHNVTVLTDINGSESLIVLENETCRIKLHISKDVTENGAWRALKPKRSL